MTAHRRVPFQKVPCIWRTVRTTVLTLGFHLTDFKIKEKVIKITQFLHLSHQSLYFVTTRIRHPWTGHFRAISLVGCHMVPRIYQMDVHGSKNLYVRTGLTILKLFSWNAFPRHGCLSPLVFIVPLPFGWQDSFLMAKVWPNPNRPMMHMQELPKHVSAIIDVMVDCCNIAACNEIADHLKGIIFQEVEQIAGEVAVYQQLNRESHHVLLSETFLQFKTCSNAIPIDKWGKYELLHFTKMPCARAFMNMDTSSSLLCLTVGNPPP